MSQPLGVETAVQLDLSVPNSPGTLAKISDVLRAADVNIEAIFCSNEESEAIVHLIVDDVETGKIVLRELGDVKTTDVLGFRLKNKPGTVSYIARMCAGANINIRNIYATTGGRETMVYVSVDDFEKARKLFK